jgi:hypothetical protein
MSSGRVGRPDGELRPWPCEGKVELGDHALGSSRTCRGRIVVFARNLGLRAVEPRMDSFDVLDRLRRGSSGGAPRRRRWGASAAAERSVGIAFENLGCPW